MEGDYKLTPDWSVFLPEKFNRRVEDGSLVLWRPGITIYVNAWNNDRDESIDARRSKIKSEISPKAFELQEEQEGAIAFFSYRLIEDGVNALYGFVFSDARHLQVAIYFDDETDIDLARSIFVSFAVTNEAA